FQQYDSDPFTF
nr:immunoglobulin light chain junction region [Macaca mulatta]